MRTLFALVLVAFVSASHLRAADEDYARDKDVQALLKTTIFGFGPVAMSPNITEGEAALRRIMKKDDAIRFLFPVFDNGTLEGKCFALIGFRLLAPDYFELSCKRVSRWADSPVKTVEGCIVGDSKLSTVIKTIREGKFDDEALGKQRG